MFERLTTEAARAEHAHLVGIAEQLGPLLPQRSAGLKARVRAAIGAMAGASKPTATARRRAGRSHHAVGLDTFSNLD